MSLISITLLTIDLVLLLVAKYRKFKWKKGQNGKPMIDNGSDVIGVTLGQLAMIGFSFVLPHLVSNYFNEGEFLRCDANPLDKSGAHLSAMCT